VRDSVGSRLFCSAKRNAYLLLFGSVLSVLRAAAFRAGVRRVVELLLYAPPFAVHFESSICPLQFSCALVRFLCSSSCFVMYKQMSIGGVFYQLQK